MDIGWLEPLPSWSTDDINQTSFELLGDLEQPAIIKGAMEAGTGSTESYSLTETVLISAALLIIIVGTIVGNILVCTAVCLVRRL